MADQVFSVETLSYEQVAKTIDHSLLGPELDTNSVIAGCELARLYDVASVCVKPCDVTLAAAVGERKGCGRGSPPKNARSDCRWIRMHM